MYSFPRTLRLLSTAAFQHVWKQGKRVSGPTLTITACQNNLDHPRLGVSISKKYVHKAVDRNRLKRLSRESFRLRQTALDGRDFVVVARKGADKLTPDQQYQQINALWDRLLTASKH